MIPKQKIGSRGGGGRVGVGSDDVLQVAWLDMPKRWQQELR